MAGRGANSAPDGGQPTLDDHQLSEALAPNRSSINTAPAIADAPPHDLESALKQIRTLQQQLGVRDARIQDLENRNHELRLRPHSSEERAEWLLDWAMQRSPDGLLEALEQPDTLLPTVSSVLGGGGSALNPEAHSILCEDIKRKTCFGYLDLPAEIRNRIYDIAAKEAFSVPCTLSYNKSCVERSEECITDCRGHDLRRDQIPAARHRLAILRVSRQVHVEAKKIYCTNLSLDLRFVYLTGCLNQMLKSLAYVESGCCGKRIRTLERLDDGEAWLSFELERNAERNKRVSVPSTITRKSKSARPALRQWRW